MDYCAIREGYHGNDGPSITWTEVPPGDHGKIDLQLRHISLPSTLMSIGGLVASIVVFDPDPKIKPAATAYTPSATVDPSARGGLSRIGRCSRDDPWVILAA